MSRWLSGLVPFLHAVGPGFKSQTGQKISLQTYNCFFSTEVGITISLQYIAMNFITKFIKLAKENNSVITGPATDPSYRPKS